MKKIITGLFKIRRQEIASQLSTKNIEIMSIEEVIRRYEELIAK